MKIHFNFWKALALASYTVAFLSKALEDGVITLEEIEEYVNGVIARLGLDVKIKVPVEGGGQEG